MNATPRHLVHRLDRPLALLVLIVAVLGAAGSVWYAAHALRISTDPAELLSADLPFRKAQAEHDHHFPDGGRPLLIVIDAVTPERADEAADALIERLADRTQTIRAAERPMHGPFFDRHGLLYQSPQQLAAMSQQLAGIEPMLDALSSDPSLPTWLDLLSFVAQQPAGPLRDALLQRTGEVIAAKLDGRPDALSWRGLLSGDGGQRDEPAEQHDAAGAIIIVQPRLDFATLGAGREAMGTVRDIADELDLTDDPTVDIRITGTAALAYEEMQTVYRGMLWIGPLAVLLVIGVLYLALRSTTLVAATVFTLGIGLALTVGFATLAVGHLNMISIAFAVLYVGLGADFAIHFVLRYRISLRRGLDRHDAIATTMRMTGESLLLCAITTALGFSAFVLTAYRGVAELGVIAGGGMFISLLTTLTVLPAVLVFLPDVKPAPASASIPRPMAYALRLPVRHRGAVLIAAGVLGVLSVVLLPQVRFAIDPLELRDPASESVQTMRDLREADPAAHWSATVLAESAQEARRRAAKLEQLELVASTTHLFRLIPDDQERKLEIIHGMADRWGAGRTVQSPRDHTVAEHLRAIARLRPALAAAGDGEAPDAAAATLDRNLRRLQAHLDARARSPDAPRQTLRVLQNRLLGHLPAAIERLNVSLQAGPVERADLPESLRRQWVSTGGVYRIDVQPAGALEDEGQTRRFVRHVQSIAPEATGPTVTRVESADAIIRAFLQASVIAFAGIVVILFVRLRRPTLVLAVLGPLLLGGAATGALMVLMGVPLNFANVIALPLLFGIAVDNGIHMVHRSRSTLAKGNLLETTTARAVLFSALTTLCSFGNLWLSPHPGMASMGQVLTIGVVLMVGAALILLPALMARPEAPAFTDNPSGP